MQIEQHLRLALVFAILQSISGFGLSSSSPFSSKLQLGDHLLSSPRSRKTNLDAQSVTTRSGFLSLASSFLLLSTSFTSTPAAAATETIIQGCPKTTGVNNCVSTSSIKQIDNYSPPWTFECSPDEAFARLKGVITQDAQLEITLIDEEARYIQADVQRSYSVKDEIEFLIKGEEGGGGVVTYRSMEKGGGSIPDFGAIRKKVESLRTKGGVFGIMGEGMTADSYYAGKQGSRGKGPLGQLKAFYGLQSGQGFEDVFD